MAHGNIYAPEKVDAALANYFRLGNLGALRELALMWVADQVDEALQEYREPHGIAGTWETRERVVVAITGAPGGEDVIRRAARMAMRAERRAARRARAPGRRARRDRRPSGSTEHRRLLDGARRRVPRGQRARRRRGARGFARAENATPARAGREPAVALERARSAAR